MKRFFLPRAGVWIFLLLLFGGGCGDLTWFVAWNTGPVEEGGLVVIIGTPHTQPLEAVDLIEGDIPKGMAVQNDGTVQGIPETFGEFDFTLELTEKGGKVLQKSYSVEVEAPDDGP